MRLNCVGKPLGCRICLPKPSRKDSWVPVGSNLNDATATNVMLPVLRRIEMNAERSGVIIAFENTAPGRLVQLPAEGAAGTAFSFRTSAHRSARDSDPPRAVPEAVPGGGGGVPVLLAAGTSARWS